MSDNRRTSALDVCECGHGTDDHPWLPIDTFDLDRPCMKCGCRDYVSDAGKR